MPDKTNVRPRRSPAQVEAFLADYPIAVRKIALKTRPLVLEIVPDALKQVDHTGRLVGYGYTSN